MPGAFGFPKYPQQQSPDPRALGMALLKRGQQQGQPGMGGPQIMPGMPGMGGGVGQYGGPMMYGRAMPGMGQPNVGPGMPGAEDEVTRRRARWGF